MPAKVALFGNCQVGGLAASMRLQCPEAQVDSFLVSQVGSPEEGDALACRLAVYDAVIIQGHDNPRLGGAGATALAEKVERLIGFPKLGFSGFHPDCLISMNRALRGLTGDYHSILLLAAAVRGVPIARVPDLFNAYVYGVVGYFDEYAKARTFLSRQARKLGFDIAPLLDHWQTLGDFMYTPNHPRIEVLWTSARRLAEIVGLQPEETSERPADDLADNVIWPVYPEIGRRLDLPGERTFAVRRQNGEVLALEEYVERSYPAYAGAAPDILAAPRVLEVAQVLAAEGV
jgi:hypothetical protein